MSRGIFEELTDEISMDSLGFDFDDDGVSIVGDPVIEAEIILRAIRDECADDREFAKLIDEGAMEMALYGVFSDADVAEEVAKKIIIKDYKKTSYNRNRRKAAIRIAKKKNDPYYAKYAKFRKLMIQYREILYKKYASQSNREAREILRNSARKASASTSRVGRSITEKIDRQVKKANAATKANKK